MDDEKILLLKDEENIELYKPFVRIDYPYNKYYEYTKVKKKNNKKDYNSIINFCPIKNNIYNIINFHFSISHTDIFMLFNSNLFKLLLF
jgi:hypothetical protein